MRMHTGERPFKCTVAGCTYCELQLKCQKNFEVSIENAETMDNYP